MLEMYNCFKFDGCCFFGILVIIIWDFVEFENGIFKMLNLIVYIR